MPARGDARGVHKYTPSQLPGDADMPRLLEFLRREFFSVYQGFEGIWQLDPQAHPPGKVQDGMIAFADGNSWDPGQGRGPYIYYDGTWHKMTT